MRISTKSITNFEASGSTELKKRHHDFQDQWLLMQGTEVQNKCAGKGFAEKLAKHAFHVINVTLFGSRGTSSENSFSSGSSQNVKSTFCTVSRGFKLGIVFQIPAKTTTNEQFPRSTCCVRDFCHNVSWLCRRKTPTYHCSSLNETLFEHKCLPARFFVFQTKTRGRRASQGVVDTTTVHHQSSRNLSRFRLPVFAIPGVRTELLSSTNVCRQLRHRRLPLLESLLQMKILPPVSIDLNARISETCLILCLATSRSLQ